MVFSNFCTREGMDFGTKGKEFCGPILAGVYSLWASDPPGDRQNSPEIELFTNYFLEKIHSYTQWLIQKKVSIISV